MNAIEIKSEDLRRGTIYVALFTAYNRYLKQGSADQAVRDRRSYRVVPPLIESMVGAWDQVHL